VPYFCNAFNCFSIRSIYVVADDDGSAKSKTVENTPQATSARASLCGSREGGVSGDDLEAFLKDHPERALEMAKAATDIHKDRAVEKLPDLPVAAAAPKSANRVKSVAFVKRKRNLVEELDAHESEHAARDEDEDEEDDEELSQPKEKKESKQKSPRVFRKAGEENEFMIQFPATMGCGGMRLGTAASVSAVVVNGPFQKEDKLDSQAHVRIIKSAVLNALSEAQQAKFAEAEAKLPETALTAFALQRVETMRVCGINVIPKLKLFLNKYFFGETPGSRFKGT